MSELDYDIDSVVDAPAGFDDPTPSFQNTFEDGPVASLGAGEFTGNTVMQDGYLQSSDYVAGTTGWLLEPDNAEFNFAVSVDALDIPDTTTDSSFHVDASGNAWWGDPTASSYTNAPAYVLATGAASFKNIAIGGATLQYQITNAGILSFGDGADGAATFSDQGTAPTGTTKTDNSAGATIFRLDRDVYYTTMTVDATVTLNPNGYRIFCTTSATINGTINRNGNNGSNGSNGINGTASGGSGGAALSDGYLKGSTAGGAGGNGKNGGGNGDAGSNGTSTANALDSDSGQAGGHGGNGSGVAVGGAGGTGGTTTESNVKLKANWHLATLLDVSSTGATVKFNTTASPGGGGGGASDNGGTNGGGGGGGSGSGGGIIALYAKTITVGAAGIITANGGNGGNGGNGANANAGVGGGGSGGNGGIVILIYNSLSNSGTVRANGGTKGTKGASGITTAATDGSDGGAGVIYQFEISL